MNIFDKVVSWLDPEAGVRRMQARAYIQQSVHASSLAQPLAGDSGFEAMEKRLNEAMQHNQRLYNIAQYDPSLNPTAMLVGEPDKDIISSIDAAKRLVRDRMMNDPQAIRIAEIFCDGVHGEGIQPYPDSKYDDPAEKDRVDGMVSDRWEDHCESTDIDVNGVYDYLGLAWMAELEKACGGGVLWIKIWNNRRDVLRKGIKHPLQYDVRSDRWLNAYKTSYQATDANGVPVGPVYPVIGGVEIDPRTRKKRGYHIYVNDPLEGIGSNTESIRIDARYVMYDAERKQLGQIRGWPIMAPIVPSLQHLEDLTESSIKRAKIDTALTAILGIPDAPMNPTMNTGGSDGFAYGAGNGGGFGGDGPVNSYGVPQTYIQPGMFTKVRKGTDIEIINPQPSNVYEPTYRNTERRLAMAVSQTYESVSGDYSKVNFISGRLAKGPVNRSMRRRQWQWVITVGKESWKDFITGCYTMNSWNIPGYPEYPSFEDIKPADMNWIMPTPDSADPLGEARADQLAVRTGRLDPLEMIKRQGKDPKQVARAYRKAYDIFEKEGINLDRLIFSGDGSNLEAASGLIDGTVDQSQQNAAG